MSSPFALAAVTGILRDLLQQRLQAPEVGDLVGGAPTVSALAPDRIELSTTIEPTQLNLFLYQISQNPGWKNHGLPVRNGEGQRVNGSPLALDLHYLVTAYGREPLHAELLLGLATQFFHENPFIPREVISQTLANVQPLPLRELAQAGLEAQVEHLRISPQTLGTEEMFKLWTAMQAKYRPSVCYQISVVLIDSPHARRSALPVRRHHAPGITLNLPSIAAVESGDARPVAPHGELNIFGTRLRGTFTRLRFPTTDLDLLHRGAMTEAGTVHRATVSDAVIQLAVPASLRAGRQWVQVVHLQDFSGGSGELGLHEVFKSQPFPFALSPVIARPAPEPPATQPREILPPRVGAVRPALDAQGDAVILEGRPAVSAEVTIQVDPAILRLQELVMVLDPIGLPADQPARTHSFRPPVNNGITDPTQSETSEIVFAVRAIPPGEYLIRLQVDGMDSQLETDRDGRFVGPRITIPIPPP